MRSLILIMAVFYSVAGIFAPEKGFFCCPAAYAAESWKAEFDDICAKTADSMNLSDQELRGLIERTEKLKPSIDALDEAQRKVYQRRLKQCKDLFVFVLESRKKQ